MAERAVVTTTAAPGAAAAAAPIQIAGSDESDPTAGSAALTSTPAATPAAAVAVRPTASSVTPAVGKVEEDASAAAHMQYEFRPDDFPKDSVVLVLADLHGHLGLFREALRTGRELAGDRHIVLVTLGDYIDNGPEVVELLDELVKIQRAPPENVTFLPILGNHDLAFLLSNDPTMFGAKPLDWYNRWTTRYMNADVLSTPAQYTGGRGLPSADKFRRAVPRAHIEFLSALPWYRRIGKLVFVHAGLNKGDEASVERQLGELRRRDMSGLPAACQPPQVNDKRLRKTEDARWGHVVITGHNKFKRGDGNYVSACRLGFDSGTCQARDLNCALIDPSTTDLTVTKPTFFSIKGRPHRRP